MPSSNQKIVHISQHADTKNLSKAQKQFNNLIKKIDAQKKVLLEWQETIPAYNQRLHEAYQPLLDEFNDRRIEWLHLLDSAYDNKAFKKTDKKKLRYLLSELAYELITSHGRDELKDLYNKHTEEGDYDTEKEIMDEAAGDMMKSMIEGMFGVDMGDDLDLSSPEKIREILHEKLREKESQEPAPKPRKKTAKQLEKEAKQKQEEENVSKSIQAVYRKLAAVLHPDREPDEAERERKTKLMQQVNIAYDKKDLLKLLELQLEVEQIDEFHLRNIAEDRLKHFNKILQEQLSELQAEAHQMAVAFKLQMNLSPFASLKPQQLMKELDMDIKDLRHSIKLMHTDITVARNPVQLKDWLKDFKIPDRHDAFDDFDPFNPFNPFY